MTSYFSLSLSLDSVLNQAQIIDLLKQSGGDCIQTGSGICVRTPTSAQDLRGLLAKNGMESGFTLTPLDAEAARRGELDGELSQDVRSFLAA